MRFGIFAHGIDVFVVGNAGDDFRPGLAAIAGAQDVRAQVIETQRVDRRVGGVGIGVAGFEDRDFLPRGESRRRDVVPVRSAVGGEPDESVVGAGPDAVDVERRRANGVDDTALRGLHFAGKDADAGWDVPSLAGEVGTDLLPGAATVASGPESVGGEIEQVRIDGREQYRLGADDAKVRACAEPAA